MILTLVRIILLCYFFLLPTLCKSQLYGALGISTPDKNLSNITGNGLLFGVSYHHKVGEKFKLLGSSSFILFESKHYPDNLPVGTPISWDYKVNMLPLLFGASFHPFNGRFTRNLFVSGKAGGQWIFFKSDNIGFQESVYYVSKELDFSYSYEFGLDLKGFYIAIANIRIASRGNTLIKSTGYLAIMANIRLLKKEIVKK